MPRKRFTNEQIAFALRQAESDECGRMRLYVFCHRPITICASLNESKISRRRHSCLSLPLKLSQYPFSHREPGALDWICAPVLATQLRSAVTRTEDSRVR